MKIYLQFINKHSDISIFAVCHRFYFLCCSFFLHKSGEKNFINKSSTSGIYRYSNGSMRRVKFSMKIIYTHYYISNLNWWTVITSSGWAHIIGSHEMRNFKCDLMMWAHPWDLMQYARSSYYCNRLYYTFFWLNFAEFRLTIRKMYNMWAISRENVSSGIFNQVRFKPACSARILKLWIEQVYISYYLTSEQRRCWSDCTDAQADLHLCCSQMA